MKEDFIVIKVEPREDYTVKVFFDNGVCCIYDASRIINKINILKNKVVFIEKCTIMHGTLCWDIYNDETTCIDIAAESILDNSSMISFWYFNIQDDVEKKIYQLMLYILKIKIVYATKLNINKINEYYFTQDFLLLETDEEYIQYSLPNIVRINKFNKKILKDKHITKDIFLNQNSFKRISNLNEVNIVLSKMGYDY